ncbi:hypothetical protein [Streptomyces sp. SID3212]|uniref:hypothetical protein n=1 Tax=Streptomyces sp. SID3212 TaxID=2690259 RepID=UPI0031F7131E
MTLASATADSPGEHLQLAAFTAAAAVLLIWVGRRQRRTGRGVIASDETIRTPDRLIPPSLPTRGHRTAGCALIVLGAIFALPAVFNTVAAIHGLVG